MLRRAPCVRDFTGEDARATFTPLLESDVTSTWQSDLLLFRCQESLTTMQITIKTPADFNFHRTVLSHGWRALLPFELDRTSWTLTRVLDVGRSKPVTVRISSGQARTQSCYVACRSSEADAAKIVRDVRHYDAPGR